MDASVRRLLSISPVALSTALALIAAEGTNAVPWFSSSAHANHCTPPPCDGSCDGPPCDACYSSCDCAMYTPDATPDDRVP
jgi:hypothetical protein